MVIDIESNVVMAVEGLDDARRVREARVFLGDLLWEDGEDEEVEERNEEREVGGEIEDGSVVVVCSSEESLGNCVIVDTTFSSLLGNDDSTVELRMVGAVEVEED